MLNVTLAISLSLLASFDTWAGSDNFISRYFTRVPEAEAHVIEGQAFDHDFDPRSIKVLVWNIKKTQESGWKEEFLSFSQNRDLILIQEAYPNNLFRETLGHFSDIQWDFGISFLYRQFGNLPTGTMIGSKVIPREFEVKHSPDLEPVTETPKAITFGKYLIEGKTENELLVVNVHGINFTSFSTFKRHMNQIEEEVSEHSGPVLIAGDFNTRTKARMRYLFNLMAKLKLTEINFKNGHQRMVAKLTNNILDHGFGRGIIVKHAEVLGSARGSDHKPMVLELSL